MKAFVHCCVVDWEIQALVRWDSLVSRVEVSSGSATTRAVQTLYANLHLKIVNMRSMATYIIGAIRQLSENKAIM